MSDNKKVIHGRVLQEDVGKYQCPNCEDALKLINMMEVKSSMYEAVYWCSQCNTIVRSDIYESWLNPLPVIELKTI